MSNVPSHSRTRRSHRRTFAAGAAGQRRTHGGDAFLPALNGAEEVYEQAQFEPYPIEPVVYPPNSIPPAAVDTTPPAVPTGLTLASDIASQSDGSKVVRLIASLTQPTDADLFGTYVEVTADNDGAQPPNPTWLNPATILIGSEATSGALLGARGRTQYWARAYAVDIFGNRSDMTATVTHTSVADVDAPPIPTNFAVAAGFRGIGVRWEPVGVADLAFYELRYALDDGTGTAPNTATWQTLVVAVTAAFVTGLTPGQKYWAQVRAVDLSGNVRTSAADPTAVAYDDNPEAGWSGLQSATAASIGAADIAANSIIASHISASGLSADVIKTGTLKVGVTAGLVDGIEVWYNGLRIGKWDETGFYIGKTAEGLPADLSASDYVRITDAGLSVYLDGVVQSAITPDGINASALTFGTLPGGHNLLQNSGFELADFAAAPSTYNWDTSTEWNASRVGSDTNVTTNAGDLSMTGVAY